MTRKLLICPWFGPLPPWWKKYKRNVRERLKPQGYDLLVIRDLNLFKQRVHDRLGVECPIVTGGTKVHDYRAAFGVLFADELRGYRFWGHTDFDCVYGRVERFVTDRFLGSLDIYSNHWDYICGPWSLYRNVPAVNELFMEHPGWERILQEPATTGWVETGYTKLVDRADAAGTLRRVYKLWHTYTVEGLQRLRWDGAKLMEGDTETMLAHFRATKQYPV